MSNEIKKRRAYSRPAFQHTGHLLPWPPLTLQHVQDFPMDAGRHHRCGQILQIPFEGFAKGKDIKGLQVSSHGPICADK